MDYKESLIEVFTPFENTLLIVSQILIALFFLIDLMTIGHIIHDSNKNNSLYIWLELGLKYAIVSLLIASSSKLFDSLKWLTETIGLSIQHQSSITYEFVVPEAGSYFYKQFLMMCGDGLEVTIKSLQYYLLNLQKFEFTLLKLVAPFFCSCIMIKSLKNLSKKYLKFAISLSFQHLFINLSLKIFPKVFNEMKPDLSLSERLTDLLPSYISIVQGIMIIITIFTSYYLPKRLFS